MQQIRDTKPHNFIQKSDQDMYAQNNTGYNTYQYQQQQGGTNRQYVNYGVDSNSRPPVVSQGGGCCCSVMWIFWFVIKIWNKLFIVIPWWEYQIWMQNNAKYFNKSMSTVLNKN